MSAFDIEGEQPTIYCTNPFFAKQLVILNEKHKLKLKRKGVCFVATVVFREYHDEHVVILREFRELVLTRYRYGQYFIRLYYKHGEEISKFIENKFFLKLAIKFFLICVVRLITASIGRK